MPMFLVPRLFLRALAPTAVLLPPATLLLSAWNPAAVFWLPVVLSGSAAVPIAVLLSPVEVLCRALKPNAVLLNPPVPVSSTLGSATVPPAVLKFPSLVVGLQPGAAQTGWPQLGVMVSSRRRFATRIRKRPMLVMETSKRRARPAKSMGNDPIKSFLVSLESCRGLAR